MSNTLKCPHCGEFFNIDNSMHFQLLNQIKNDEFEKELQRRLDEKVIQMEETFDLKIQAAISNTKLDCQKENEYLMQKNKDKLDAQTILVSKLQNQINQNETSSELAVIKATAKLKDEFEIQLSSIQTELDYYKDLKTKMSTKMVGESLEQHCAIEFEKIRGALPKTIEFDKDNEISETGSKGDFIYREFDEDGTEVVSIMFEMKNEMDTTASKHKNEDFFKELDKDRKEKHCEYAILVTLLETDNELYNTGILDVSYRFNKMYVIRPQFFTTIISLLRNAAGNALKYKQELARHQQMNIDVTTFEADLLGFKDAFSKNYDCAHRKYDEAIDEIDKSILHMQKIKDALVSCDRQLRLANTKADNLTIDKLTKDNRTMKKMFDKIDN